MEMHNGQHDKQKSLISSSSSSSAGGEAHRGGEYEGSQGGALHYATEPVHPQHQGGLPAERRVRVQAADQEEAHVHVLCDADATPTVSEDI